MNTKKVALVIVDISGYTHFIRTQRMTAIHAEEIIFELLEAVIDHAAHPLVLNKIEGDAIFLYAEMNDANQGEVARDVANQAQTFLSVFYARAKKLSVERADCACNACQRVHDLRLKAFLHLGEAVFRNIRQFEELAGEEVITLHRLLKNSIPAREYILLTEAFYAQVSEFPGLIHTTHSESYDDLGRLMLHIFQPPIGPDEADLIQP